LIGVLGVDAQPHVNLDGLVKLGELDLLDEWDSVVQAVRTLFHLFGRGFKLLTVL
jgi:hypothetical protein